MQLKDIKLWHLLLLVFILLIVIYYAFVFRFVLLGLFFDLITLFLGIFAIMGIIALLNMAYDKYKGVY